MCDNMILLKSLFSFLLLSITIFRNCYVAGVDLPPEWISYVEKIRQFDDNPWAPVCITYSEITTSEAITHNFIPNIIILFYYMIYLGSKLSLSSFLQYFWNHKLYYKQRMHNICINDDWICCDHTFKSVRNIVIYQTRDNQVGK